MGQWSNEGSLGGVPPNERRPMLAQSVLDHEGNLSLVAYDLGYHRSHIYRLIYQYRLWYIVNTARRTRLERVARERRRN